MRPRTHKIFGVVGLSCIATTIICRQLLKLGILPQSIAYPIAAAGLGFGVMTLWLLYIIPLILSAFPKNARDKLSEFTPLVQLLSIDRERKDE